MKRAVGQGVIVMLAFILQNTVFATFSEHYIFYTILKWSQAKFTVDNYCFFWICR